MNLVKVISVRMPSHHVIKQRAEEASISMCLTLCTAGQRPRYVTEDLHDTQHRYCVEHNITAVRKSQQKICKIMADF